MRYLSGRLYVNTNKYNSQPRSKSWESVVNIFIHLQWVKKGTKIFIDCSPGMRWWAWAFTRPTLVITFKDLIQSSKRTGRCLERWCFWQLWWHWVLSEKIVGCFPGLMFSTDHGGQNIQPSALQVPNQHWLCRGEKPLWIPPTVISSNQFMLKSFSGLGSVQWGSWIRHRYVWQSFGQVWNGQKPNTIGGRSAFPVLATWAKRSSAPAASSLTRGCTR